MGTVVEKVYDQNIKGSNHNPYLGENKTVRLQLYAVQFDNSPGINRIGNTQMIPDYQEVREQKLNDLGIKAVGQCYLKDSCICDEQMLDEIFILDKREIEAANLAEQRQKQLDKIFAKETSDAKWVELFTRIKNSNGTMDDLLTELKGYKFPTETLTI
jgi:hypothetical protein